MKVLKLTDRNAQAYPEIEQELSLASGKKIKVNFTPICFLLTEAFLRLFMRRCPGKRIPLQS
jgi:hypothetical protein